MRNGSLPTVLERLIQPLPSDLKAAMLEAWKNEDIPHDENDSVYRLMVLLSLYARFYQDIATTLAGASSKIGQIHETHLIEVRTTYAKQAEQNRELLEDLRYIDERITDLRQVVDEKPRNLRSQFESEVKSVLSNLRSEGQKTIKEFSDYTSRFKEDCEEWRARAYFTFLVGGFFVGVGASLLIWGAVRSLGS